ncbi:hypothetical protein [Legionella jamestowniensis]|uniref:Histone-lysine N-methyltransferase, H3 lysine-79 specific n=1 Tax=Legionella jamestowniensis TaxID=455 RepID=A0A0W0UIB1_9GAMM|nr:hypothetical protein [Legionella jamestowniensis]KTD07604.1 putative methyltransferase [Legionella jamestowniensis]OCH99352.1 hypothetical protein A8135_06595 [Legionella jamestowniensis]SFL59264.1 Histone methylation protein DOT1 [Legionella jamestowniensis DSM 19215]
MLIFFLLLLLAAILIWFGRRQQRAVKRWRKALSLDKHFAIYQALYNNINGFALSQHARRKEAALEYTYGEIDFESFIALLSLCQPNPATVFYDLGSGTGTAVIACTLVFDVRKSCGIELFSELHHCALRQKQRLQAYKGYQEKAKHITFIKDDFLNCQFSDASLVFINATAFFGGHWLAISKHLEQLQPGSVVISTSKALVSPLFITRKVTAVNMSWGVVNAFIQEKIAIT